MNNFGTLLVGSAMLAGVAVASWCVGLLMGIGVAKWQGFAPSKHSDIEQLLARERAAPQQKRPESVTVAPSGPIANG